MIFGSEFDHDTSLCSFSLLSCAGDDLDIQREFKKLGGMMIKKGCCGVFNLCIMLKSSFKRSFENLAENKNKS